MPHNITRDDVIHIAKLSQLKLNDDQVDVYTAQLGNILNYAAEMNELDLDGVAATAHPFELGNVMRTDEVGALLDRQEVLDAAPAHEGSMFCAPPTIGEAP